MVTKRSKQRKAAPASPVANHSMELAELVAAGNSPANLQRLAEYRSLMLFELAHDLRTPLTAILGFTEILIDFEKLTESQREICGRIQNSGRELQGTINLVSDLARLDLDARQVVRREFSLSNLLEALCEGLSRKAKKKKINLECRLVGKIANVVSDESKLRQILYNVLAWSIVRSPEGGQVTVAAVKKGTAVQLTIRDEGESIDVSRGLASAVNGVDKSSMLVMGLDVAERLAEMLGAAFTLANRKPRGLSIVLQIPSETAFHKKHVGN
jgi:signal transduction histidine kinase